MAVPSKRLPQRFPVGTKFVLEDRVVGGVRQYVRYLVFPDGRRVNLPAAGTRVTAKPARRRRPHRR